MALINLDEEKRKADLRLFLLDKMLNKTHLEKALINSNYEITEDVIKTYLENKI